MMSTEQNTTPSTPRHLYMVLSPHSLAYANLALQSLLQNSDEDLDLHLITDSTADKQQLEQALAGMEHDEKHQCHVVAEDELADAEADRFKRFPNLRAFRHGHPCWRKITDPVLIGKPGDELILLDPDLYFPSRFRFEPTPAHGLLLMWQRPNCLLPPEVVRAAIAAKIPLARHVDIGVSHWRLSEDLSQLEWVDWLIGKLGGPALPRAMHVEAVVWSAIAMHQGGGYLDPLYWRCWERTQGKRIRRKLGADGSSILASEPWSQIKCFHAGGEVKWWLPAAKAAGEIEGETSHLQPGRVTPFVELTSGRYEREQKAKSLIGGLGYYRLFAAGNR